MNLCFAWQAWHLWHWVGVALGDIHLQAWHSETFTFVLRGRRGTYGTGWRAWTGLVAGDAAALCVAGVAIDVLVDVFLLWWPWPNVERGCEADIAEDSATIVSQSVRLVSGTRSVNLWRSLKHVLFSDMFSASLRFLLWPVYECPAPACCMVAPAC